MFDQDGDPRNYDPNADPTFNYDTAPPPAPPPQEQLGSFFVPVNSDAPNGQQDLSYWQSRYDQGLPGAPSVGDMFDLETGQLKPGWKRTAKGYEYVGTASVAPTTATGGTPPGGVPLTIATGGGGGGGGNFDYGRPMENQFSPYREMAPFVFSQGAFSYQPFAGSSWDDAQKEPGFQKSQERLAKMIQNTAAYRGVLRSGATIGDLGTYLDQNQGQNFQQFDTRNFRNWSANRENAADAWSRNLGAEQWSYGQQANENQNFNNYRFNTEKATADDLLSRWSALINSTTALAKQ